jgi:hypothetical protein
MARLHRGLVWDNAAVSDPAWLAWFLGAIAAWATGL